VSLPNLYSTANLDGDKMMILYACVSKHWRDLSKSPTELAGGSPHQFEMLGQCAIRLGNFEETAVAILQKLRSEEMNEERVTITEGQHAYHIKLVKTGINQMFLFFCVTFIDLDRSHAYTFLDDLSDDLGGGIQNKTNDWTREISRKLETHNGKIKVASVKNEMDATKEIMVRNIDEVVRRGEALESLQGTADALVNNATDFTVQSRRVRRQAWWQNTKVKIIIGVVVVVLVYVVITSACGGFLWPNCVPSSSSSSNHPSTNDTLPPYYS